MMEDAAEHRRGEHRISGKRFIPTAALFWGTPCMDRGQLPHPAFWDEKYVDRRIAGET
jgi:hypothetical protein